MSQFDLNGSEKVAKKRGRPKMTEKEKATAKAAKEKRQYTPLKVVNDPGVRCNHCGHAYGHKRAHKYPNGNQRYLCGGCGKPFVVRRIAV